MVLGDNCALIEATSDGNTYSGVYQARVALSRTKAGPSETDMKNRHLLSNLQTVDEQGDGNPIVSGAASDTLGAFMMALSAFRFVVDPKEASYGTLWPGERTVLLIKFKMGSGLKPNVLSRVTCVSPVVLRGDETHAALGVVLCDFTNPDAAGNGNKHGTRWKPSRSRVIALDFDSPARVAQDSGEPAYVRVFALNWLAEFQGKRAVEIARTRLSAVAETNEYVRSAAIQILGILGDLESTPALLKRMDPGQPPALRCVAALALGEMRAAEAVAPLTACTRDKEEAVAKCAIEALGRLGSAAAAKALDALIADKDYAHGIEAVTALAKCGSQGAMSLASRLADGRFPVPKAIRLGELLQPAALKEFKGSDEDRARLRREVEPALDEVAKGQVLAALETAAIAADGELAKAAVDAYADVPGKRVSRFLLNLADRGQGPLPHVLRALVKRREPEAGPRILKYITTSTPGEIRRTAIDAASDLGLADAAGPLSQVLTTGTGDDGLRAASARALGKLKASAARGALDSVLRDASQSGYLRRMCLDALKELPDGPSEDTLLKVATSTKDDMRWECLKMLCKSRSDRASAAIQAALSETDEGNKWRRESLRDERSSLRAERKEPRTTDTDFSKELASTSEAERCDAVRKLGEKKEATAIPALKRLLKTETSLSVLTQLGDTFAALNCRDGEVISGFVAKLELKEPGAADGVAKVLRKLTGRKIGPYGGESATELAEDVAIWNSCLRNIAK